MARRRTPHPTINLETAADKARAHLAYFPTAEKLFGEFHLNAALRRTQATLDNFTKRFTDNPADAFRWSDDAFRAAAERRVALAVQDALVAGRTITEILAHLTAELSRMADDVPSSTSVPANVMANEHRRAVATMVEQLGQVKRHHDDAVAALYAEEMGL